MAIQSKFHTGQLHQAVQLPSLAHNTSDGPGDVKAGQGAIGGDGKAVALPGRRARRRWRIATPVAASDLISFLKALSDCWMRRGIRFPQWWMLLVAILAILSGQGSLVGLERHS